MKVTRLPSILIVATVILTAAFSSFETSAQRKSVGLVLSGGGAKGVAHITAIKVLEEAGIPIDYIAGTSMGAIIGGLYAIGYDTYTLDSLVRAQDWPTLLSDRVSRRNLSFGAKENNEKYILTVPLTNERKFRIPTGLVGGYNVYNLLYELTINYHDSLSFDRLPIPFQCVAYDMVTGDVIVLDKGYLPEAIRASMSIPGAFQPVNIGDMMLVDGGVGNNFPTDVVRAMGAEIVIGVDVTAPLRTKDELKSLPNMVDQLTSFLGQQAYEDNLKLVDFYVHPDITGYNAGSFSPQAIDTLLVRGESAMMERWDDLIALKGKIGISEQYRLPPRPPANMNKIVFIEEIKFEGLKSQSEKTLRRLIGISERSEVTTDELHVAVSRLQGLNTLSEVHYRLDGHSPYDLTFIVTERSRNTLSLGFSFDTEEMAALLLNVTLAGRNMSNSHFDVTGKLSNNPFVKGAYILGNETKPRLSVSYLYKYNDLSLYSQGKKTSNLDFGHHSADVNFSNISVGDFKLDVGLRYDYYKYRSVLSTRDEMNSISSEGLVNYYVSMRLETLNSRYYPTRGVLFLNDYTLSTSNMATYKGGEPFGAIGVNFTSALSASRRVTFMPGFFGRVLIGGNVAFPMKNFMGGAVSGRYLPQQFSFTGVHNFEMFENALMGLRLDSRVRLWAKYFITLKLNYAKQDNDFFNILNGEDIFGAGLNFSYNSFIGPIDLLVEYSTYTKKAGVYFNLGYYF